MDHGRLRILYLSASWPHGASFGGQLRALHMGRALKQLGDVTLSVVSSDAADEQSRNRTNEEFRVADQIFPVLTPNRRIIQKLRRAFDRKYLNVHGLAASPADRQRIISAFSEYDL